MMRVLLAAELIEEEAINEMVDTLVAADMIEEEAAEAVEVAEEVEEEA